MALALALAFRGFLAGVGGDLEAARGYLGRALPLGRAVADAKTMGWVLHLQGMVLSGSREPDDLAAGRRALEEAVSVYRAAGDRHRAAEVLGDLGGSVAWRARESAVDAEAVRVMLEESARVLNELRDRRGAAFALRMLGELARWRGDHAAARALYRQALPAFRDAGDRLNIGHVVEAHARIAQAEGRPARAARLLGAAARVREASGQPLMGENQDEHDRAVAAARDALGGAAFEVAWTQGRDMTLEQAVADALEEPPPEQAAAPAGLAGDTDGQPG